ncbi:MAG: hypothetical protein KAK00_06590 [Nanoarchaeota archaeon]|nr:hypothetical protein [Nanoarchaeota archaeon]
MVEKEESNVAKNIRKLNNHIKKIERIVNNKGPITKIHSSLPDGVILNPINRSYPINMLYNKIGVDLGHVLYMNLDSDEIYNIHSSIDTLKNEVEYYETENSLDDMFFEQNKGHLYVLEGYLGIRKSLATQHGIELLKKELGNGFSHNSERIMQDIIELSIGIGNDIKDKKQLYLKIGNSPLDEIMNELKRESLIEKEHKKVINRCIQNLYAAAGISIGYLKQIQERN